MKRKKDFDKLPAIKQTQIKMFMEWGTGKNDINSCGIPEQMTIREKARYSIAVTLGVFVIVLLEKGVDNCIAIACIEAFMIAFLTVFMMKKDHLIVQTLVVFILEWNLSILLYVLGWLKNIMLIVIIIHVVFTIGGLITVDYCKRHNLYVNSEAERKKQIKCSSISTFITSGAGTITIVALVRTMQLFVGDGIMQIATVTIFLLIIGWVALVGSVYCLKVFYRSKYGLATSFDIEFQVRLD